VFISQRRSSTDRFRPFFFVCGVVLIFFLDNSCFCVVAVAVQKDKMAEKTQRSNPKSRASKVSFVGDDYAGQRFIQSRSLSGGPGGTTSIRFGRALKVRKGVHIIIDLFLPQRCLHDTSFFVNLTSSNKIPWKTRLQGDKQSKLNGIGS
jgi:hypothetical protein